MVQNLSKENAPGSGNTPRHSFVTGRSGKANTNDSQFSTPVARASEVQTASDQRRVRKKLSKSLDAVADICNGPRSTLERNQADQEQVLRRIAAKQVPESSAKKQRHAADEAAVLKNLKGFMKVGAAPLARLIHARACTC